MLLLLGDGKQFRDFIYVEDVVDLLMKLSESDMEGEVFNAGTGKRTSINALYETISGIMKKKIVPKHIDPVDDPNTLANIEKAERLLRWRPKYSLVEGLEKTINGKT
jgi:nucleoside-diphosphate-sugar epimerase